MHLVDLPALADSKMYMEDIKMIKLFAALFLAFSGSLLLAQEIDRRTLPIREPYLPKVTELDARNATAPEPFQLKAPEGAPNVIVILVDDLGFAGTSHFGGPIATPTFDRLADGGVSFNQFHSTALCSPTRQALKTGRNATNGW